MPLYEVFSHSDRYHYRAKLFSLATCFLILCTALTFLPPFLFAYFAGGYWTKESSYSEQARVNYSSQYILLLDNSEGSLSSFFSSSFATLNSISQNALIPSTSTSELLDTNKDGITDQISVSLQLIMNSGISIDSMNLFLIFQYELQAKQYINMQTMALMNLSPPTQISTTNNPTVTIVGDLILQQRQPIQSSGTDLIYNKSIIEPNNLANIRLSTFDSIIDNYLTRKYYTTFQSESIQWTDGTDSTSGNLLTLNILLNIRHQSIRFIPGFWQEFKWGWIQYVCVLLPFIAVFNRIKEFVFRNQFVRTLVEMPMHRYKQK